MGEFSDSFRAEKMRSGNPAVYLLKMEYEGFAASPQKLEVCESIAHWLFQLEQFDDAGNWYEAAGRLILAQPSAVQAVKALSALDEYEKALECYRRNEDEEKLSELSSLISELRRACASA